METCHIFIFILICNICTFYWQTGGAFEGVVDDVVSPFGYKRGEGIDAGFGEHDWICSRDRARTDPIFESLSPVDGKITGAGKLSSCFFFLVLIEFRFKVMITKLPIYILFSLHIIMFLYI